MLKNITLSADEKLIHQARKRALSDKKSLNTAFREWLIQYAQGEIKHIDFKDVMKQLKHVKAGKHFSREEMNER